MKGMEDRGWDDMLQRLDSALPTHNKTGGFGRYMAAFILILILFTAGGYIAIRQLEINLTPDVVHTPNEKSNNRENNLNHEPVSDDLTMTAAASTQVDDNDGAGVKDVATYIEDVSNSETISKSNNYRSRNGSMDANARMSSTITANSMEQASGQDLVLESTLQKSNAINLSSENEQKKLSVTEDIDLLPLAEAEVMTTTNDNLPLIALEMKKTYRRLGYSSVLGMYSNIQGRYYGMDIAPQVDFRVTKGTSVFFRLPVRFKHTLDNKIVRDVSNDLNSTFEQKNLFLPDNLDIQSGKVNSNTMDINMLLGIRQQLGDKFSISAYGICGYDNVLGLIQAFSRIPEFSSTANIAYRTVNTSIAAKKDGWTYGSGVEAEIKLASRHSLLGGMNYYFESGNRIEAGLGYRFRFN